MAKETKNTVFVKLRDRGSQFYDFETKTKVIGWKPYEIEKSASVSQALASGVLVQMDADGFAAATQEYNKAVEDARTKNNKQVASILDTTPPTATPIKSAVELGSDQASGQADGKIIPADKGGDSSTAGVNVGGTFNTSQVNPLIPEVIPAAPIVPTPAAVVNAPDVVIPASNPGAVDKDKVTTETDKPATNYGDWINDKLVAELEVRGIDHKQASRKSDYVLLLQADDAKKVK